AVPEAAGRENGERDEDRREGRDEDAGESRRRMPAAPAHDPHERERNEDGRPQLRADRRGEEERRDERALEQERRDREHGERRRPVVEAGEHDRAGEKRRGGDDGQRRRTPLCRRPERAEAERGPEEGDAAAERELAVERP